MIQPMGSRLVVEARLVEDKTSGGILLPTVKNQTQQVGVVNAVGTGRILSSGARIPSDYRVGDTVSFAKFAGTQVQHEGKSYFIIDERDILARVMSGENA